MKRIIIFLIIVYFITTCVIGCAPNLTKDKKADQEYDSSSVTDESGGNEETEASLVLYFPDKQNSKMITEVRNVKLVNNDDIYQAAVDELLKGPYDKEKFNNVFNSKIKLLNVKKYEDIVEVNLSKEFAKTADDNNNIEIIRTISIVNTLAELQNVKYVKILIEGEELKDLNDEPYGFLEKFDTDIEKVLKQEKANAKISKEEKVCFKKIILYFKDKYSEFVIPEIREIEIIDNSLEKAVINELIKGPQKQGLVRTIPEGTQLLDFNISKGTAVVTFSEEMSSNFNGGSANEEAVISSIANTLTELPHIKNVKINIKHKKKGNYGINTIGGHFLLDKPIERIESRIGKRINLYFAEQNAENLIPEYRAIEMGIKSVARRAIQELINGPKNEKLFPTIPEGTQLLSISIKDEICYVNFSNEIIDNHKGGSAGEAMTIYSIVNTLTQFDSIDKVQILVDDKARETLAGHIAIDQPIARNAKLIKEEEKR
ncbi:MAG: GerMN domain-containing protein [Clostridia bacterium]|nr:GerMN domain-containing protein [Clostridia bacterium]